MPLNDRLRTIIRRHRISARINDLLLLPYSVIIRRDEGNEANCEAITRTMDRIIAIRNDRVLMLASILIARLAVTNAGLRRIGSVLAS